MPRPTEGRILQIKDRNVVRIWNSQSEIMRELNVKYPMINRAVNRGCKAYGSYWRKEKPEFKGRIFPQVGDVWYIDGREDYKVHILSVTDTTTCYVDNEDYFDDCATDYFSRIYRYLGKSKVKIEDLFKTENK